MSRACQRSRKLPLKRHHCPARGQRNYLIAYNISLGPSPFDSAPRVLRDMELLFLGELPL